MNPNDPARLFWANHTSDSLHAMVARDPVAVLPIGAIEQHGPHLPLSVDTDINAGLVTATAEILAPTELPVLFLPPLPIGKSTEHLDFPGSLSFSTQTLIAMWMEIGACVARTGIKRLVFFNSHGGQVAPMDIVARDLRVAHDLLTFSCNWFGLGLPEGLLSPHENTYGIHAGELETSMMLALHPNKCRMEKARNFRSHIEDLNQGTRHLGLGMGGKLGWKANDLNPQGACGDASVATAQTGTTAINHVAAEFAAMLHEVHAYDLGQRPRA
ncbi:MAG: creatininase family protein [Sulfitobacter sp.]